MLNIFKKEPPLNYIFSPYKVTGIKPFCPDDLPRLKLDESYLDETLSKNKLIDQNEN
jgi:hypothetical protein